MTEGDRTYFLPWSEPALPQAARLLIEEYADDGVARMQDAHLVLPGASAGRRLKELLVEEASRRELRLVPPRVVTIGQAPELLYTNPRAVAHEAVSRLAWAAALRRAPGRRLVTVFARRPDGDALHEWGLLARELARLHREVARGGHRFGDVAERCREGAAQGRLSFDDARRWEVLAEVQHEYAQELDRAGLDDAELARLAALREERLEAPGDIWLIGVSEMPGVTRQAFGAVEGAIRVLVHAPEDRQGDFDDFGCVLPEAWAEAVVPLDDNALAMVDQPADQAAEVARTLAALGGARATDEIVVGVPDAEVIPWVEERLTESGVPVRDAAGIPVQNTAPYRLLTAVAELLDSRRYEAFAALVRHPDVADWVPTRGRPEPALSRPGGWLETLDEWYNEYLPARLPEPGGTLRGEQSRWGPVVGGLVRTIDDDLLLPLADTPTDRPLSAWVGPILELLQSVYGTRELRRDRLRDRRLLRVLEFLADAAHAFESLPAALDESCSAAVAVRLVLEQASGRAIPADPSRAAVELLGWLELHLDDAPVTVVTGVNEPRLPESVTADPFLPDRMRQELGLVDNRTRYARDAYRLTAMVHSTATLRLIAGRRSTAGDPLRPSRLLFAADPGTVTRRVRRFYGQDEAPAQAPEPSDATDEEATDEEASAPDGSGFALPPEPRITLTDPVTSLRVTDFRALLTDPYGWALSRLRGCETVADGAREMDGMRFGALAHRVLEDFGTDAVVASTDQSEIVARLDQLLNDRVARRFGPEARDAHVAVRVQVEQLRARLHRFARWHAGWIAQGWEVRGVELGTPEGGAPLDVDSTPVGIRARIDRVDYHRDLKRWAVFDYKTSDRGQSPEKTHRKGRGKNKDWIDLQLPLYHWLLPGLTDEAGEPLFPAAADEEVQAGYILLPRELDEVGDALAGWDGGTLEDAVETAREVVRQVREGAFTFDSDRRPSWPDPELEALVGRGQLAGIDEEAGE